MKLTSRKVIQAPVETVDILDIGQFQSVMRTKPRSSDILPVEFERPKTHEIVVIAVQANSQKLSIDNVDVSVNMAQVNGYYRDQSPVDLSIVPPGRVISTSMMRQAAEQTPTTDNTPWSSAVGHASTGKSGRVIERLQSEIDRLNREKQLFKMRFEEIEKTNEMLNTRNQLLQDRNSNYEQSHEANLRQLQRKERQVEDLREELNREKLKTVRAEESAQAAAMSEDSWREQASQSKAMAQQKESEYDAIVACRNMDNERHQTGLNKIKNGFDLLLRQREEDLDKQKKLEIIAEQQKQTIEQLEELTKRLNANFKAYRTEIDSAISDLRATAGNHDKTVYNKLEEMRLATGEMRWVVCVEREVNHKEIPPMPQNLTSISATTTNIESPIKTNGTTDTAVPESTTPSPTKRKSIDFRRHRKKDSKSVK